MADIKITLEAVSKQFADAMRQSAVQTTQLVAEMKKLDAALDGMSKRMGQAEKANKELVASNKKLADSHKEVAKDIALTTAKLAALYQTAKFAFGLIKSAADNVITSIDEFQRGTIGSAIAITNLADKTLLFGTTWEQAFQKNLAFSRDMFVELERVAARYFASSTDLQLAFNTLAQRGVVVRREELDLLGQLTDTILLLTGGQQSTIQIQEEIRSLLNGSARATAQLSQLAKAFGLDIKEIAAQIRATQSLKPLEPILQGAKAANKEVQKTFQATINALEVQFNQLKRVAGEGFFNTVVNSLGRLQRFIQENQATLAKFGAIAGQFFGLLIERVTDFLETFSKAGGAKEALSGIVNVISTLQVGVNALFEVLQGVLAIILQIPIAIQGVIDALAQWKVGPIEEAFGKIKKNMDAVFDTFDKRPLLDRLLAQVREYNDAIDQAEKKTRGLTGGKNSRPQAVTPPFIESEESKRLTSQLADELYAITIRATRAETQFLRFREAAISEEGLQALRREFALLEKGFKITTDGVVQGVINMDHELLGLIPVLGEAFGGIRVTETGQYVDMLGDMAEAYSDIRDRVIAVGRAQDTRQFINLFQQVAHTADQFLKFVATSESQAAEIIADTAGKIREEAQKNFDEKSGESKDLIKTADRAVEIAKERLALVRSLLSPSGKSGVKSAAEEAKAEIAALEAEQSRLQATQDKFRAEAVRADVPFEDAIAAAGGIIEENQKRLQQLPALIVQATAKYQDQLGLLKLSRKQVEERIKLEEDNVVASRENQFSVKTNENKLQAILDNQLATATAVADQHERRARADSDLAIEARRKDLIENQLRALQQINVLQGQAASTAQQGSAFAQQQERAAAASLPRTDLQAQLAPLQQARTALNQYIATLLKQVASLNTAAEMITNLTNSDKARLAVVTEALEVGEFASAEAKRVAEEEKALLTSRIAANEAMMESTQNFTNDLVLQAGKIKEVSEQALATQEFQTKIKAVTDSFQQAFDRALDVMSSSITDSFEGKKTNFAQAFKGIADSLFKDNLKTVFSGLKTSMTEGLSKALGSLPISDTMKSQLGPAFMAGFGLIASFVLGQLLGDQGGEATAGNPKVGIQSTEQVRGLIGGETQIPIGQIGESLQDALVPTNLLLARIALGVESITPGGASFEQSLSDAFGSTLQTQG